MLRLHELRRHQRLLVATGRLTGDIVGLHHVQLAMPAGREDEAELFYAELLGLERIPKPPELEARGGCWFRSSAVEIHLGVEEGFRPARKAHPAFIVVGLDALAERLERNGVPIQRDVELEGHRRFYATDPFGNRLEFIEPVVSLSPGA